MLACKLFITDVFRLITGNKRPDDLNGQDSEPKSAEEIRFRIKELLCLADYNRWSGRWPSAEGEYRRALSLARYLIEKKTYGAEKELDLVLGRIGDYEGFRGKPAEAALYISQKLEVEKSLFNRGIISPGHLALVWSELAWWQIMAGQPEQAIKSALAGTEFDTNQDELKMHLAHAYMLADRFAESERIHVENRNITLDDGKSWREAVLEEFETMRRSGLEHPDMARIEKLLGF
jgi:hypothetical protein